MIQMVEKEPNGDDPVTVGELSRQLKKTEKNIDQKFSALFRKLEKKDDEDRQRDIKIARQKQRCDDVQAEKAKDENRSNRKEDRDMTLAIAIVGWAFTIGLCIFQAIRAG